MVNEVDEMGGKIEFFHHGYDKRSFNPVKSFRKIKLYSIAVLWFGVLEA